MHELVKNDNAKLVRSKQNARAFPTQQDLMLHQNILHCKTFFVPAGLSRCYTTDTMKKKQNTQTQPRLRTAQGIMVVLSILALLAGAGAAANLSTVSDAALAVETWRMIGFFTFAGLFAYLARSPQSSRALWGIVIANKLALTIAGLLYVGRAVPGASDFVTFDGTITAFLIVASVLAGVWKR